MNLRIECLTLLASLKMPNGMFLSVKGELGGMSNGHRNLLLSSITVLLQLSANGLRMRLCELMPQKCKVLRTLIVVKTTHEKLSNVFIERKSSCQGRRFCL